MPSPSGLFFWFILLVYSSGLFFWFVLLVCSSGLFFWFILSQGTQPAGPIARENTGPCLFWGRPKTSEGAWFPM
jgi:hypothetical protein